MEREAVEVGFAEDGDRTDTAGAAAVVVKLRQTPICSIIYHIKVSSHAHIFTVPALGSQIAVYYI